MANADKKRYTTAMADYTVPDDGESSPAKGKKGKKKKKDPDAPKQATTSFLAFSNEMRPKVKAEHPEASFGDLGKKIGGKTAVCGSCSSPIPQSGFSPRVFAPQKCIAA
jgi:hypothetical protein